MRDTTSKIFYLFAILSCIAVTVCAVTDHLALALAITLLPFFFIILALSFANRLYAFMLLFVVNYFIPVLEHYITGGSLGILMDIAIIFNIVVIVAGAMFEKPDFSRISKELILAIGVWVLYCLAEVLNPRMRDIRAWLSTIRNMALYFLLVTILVQLCVKDLKQLRSILLLWSILVLVSIAKAAFQKYVGFTPGDKYFLNVMDGKRTHLIYYGTRYFSIFSDAANFGGSMGLATVVFTAVGLHTPGLLKKSYYFIVAALACYGMFISGTRSALVVPVAGILTYLALVKDFKKMVPVSLVLAGVVFVLAFTTLGNSNTTIRRARTVFNRNEDLSYLIRKENQSKLRQIMESYPFGNSLGMSAGRAKRYGDFSPLTDIPTDSWFVQIWVETGIAGQLLYFLLMGFIFIKGGIIIFFRLKKPEIKGLCAGMLAGVAGLFVMSSNNEVFTQFPNGVIVYTLIAIVFMAEKIENES